MINDEIVLFSPAQDQNAENLCSICLDDLSKSLTYQMPECQHIFHNDCIIQWLRTGNPRCPVCRSEQNRNETCRFLETGNVFRMIIDYSRRKDASKKIVKMVKKYKKLHERFKKTKKTLTNFVKQHKDILSKRSKLEHQKWSQRQAYMKIKREIANLPIQPIQIRRKK
jgi:hypothetical protein